MDAVHSTVIGSACAGLVLDAGSREVTSDVCSVGDRRLSFSEKMLSSSSTLIVSAEQ